MKTAFPLAVLTALSFSTAATGETRQLGSHEHGVGTLDIAVEGQTVSMAFRAPGADIVGFEHKPVSNEELAAVAAAIDVLSQPFRLFALPEQAGCSVESAAADLSFDTDEEGHDEHSKDDEHKSHDHDHAHDEKHDGHSEFEANYTLACATPAALEELRLTYFEQFPNAREVRVQIVSTAGSSRFDVTREAPSIRLPALF